MFKKSFRLMAEAGNDDDGSAAAAAAAAAAVARGDEVGDPAAAAAAAAAAAPAEKTDEEIAAEELAAKAAADAEAAAAADKDKPRDEAGKFAKKEKDDARIPKERFDEAVGKERQAREAAEARAAAAEALVRKEEENAGLAKINADINALNSEYAKLLIDGENDKAAEVMTKIQQLIEYRADSRNAASMAAATTQAVEQVRWDSAVAALEAKHVVLNPDSEMYDQDLTDIVIAEQQRIMQMKGFPASRALLEAADKIMKKFVGEKIDPIEAEKARGLAASRGAQDRKAEQVAKNLSTASKQPGSLAQSGKDSDKAGENATAGAGITRAEFDALPEATKAKMRGDFV